jgi:threonine aldolase
VGQTGHTYMYEGGGAAVLGGIQPNPIPFAADGSLPLDQIEATIKPDDVHFAITRLVCLENTQAGKVLPMEYLSRYSEMVRAYGLRRHLDGARVANAAVKLGVSLADICQHFDTVSICLSKGLGAPVGSLLVGDRETIRMSRRWRKMVGGGMRQAGGLAAAGIYALTHQFERLQEDHDKAARVAEALTAMPAFTLAETPQTNMVMLSNRMDIAHLRSYLAEKGINILGARWVFHLDISERDVDYLIDVCRDWVPPQTDE